MKEAFIPRAHAEELTFKPQPFGIIPTFPEEKELTPKEHLAKVCEDDEKCVCVNDAIFRHDSSWATAGVGKRAKNPCNTRIPGTWSFSVPTFKVASVNGTFAGFNTLHDGVTACVELYNRFYKELPADTLVSRWTDGGGNTAYRTAVRNCF